MPPTRSSPSQSRRAPAVGANGANGANGGGSASTRRDAERAVLDELDAWQASNVPDASAPLDADDLVRLLRTLVATLGLDPAVSAEFSVNTLHYYRRKDI